MARSSVEPLVVIVGQTGIGKSALALQLATHFNGEIIAADSRTIYRGMDIGTAKPTLEDRHIIPHHGLDVVDPGEKFSVYDFKELALAAISDIARRGKISFLVGGSGLYVDAVLYDFIFRPPPDAVTRERLLGLSVEDLQHEIIVAGLSLPTNQKNPVHLRRTLESGMVPVRPYALRPNSLVIGLTMPPEELRKRIEQRTAKMVADGLLAETRQLYEKYGDAEPLKTPGYRAAVMHMLGQSSLADVERQVIRSDMQLAKRQRTWFKRNKHIHWLMDEDKLVESVAIITTFMNERRIS